MAWPDSDYPGGIDAPPDPDSTLDGTPLHSELHLFAHDAIERIETELGTNPSGSYSTVDDRFQAVGETVVVAFTPAGSTVGTPAGNNWVTLTSALTVPSWCTGALVTMHVDGVFSATDPSSWILLSRITGTSASSSTICHFPAATNRKDISWASAVSSPSTGTQSLIVHATRTGSGTGILTADASSRFSATVVFQG